MDHYRQLVAKVSADAPDSDKSFWQRAFREIRCENTDQLSCAYRTLLELLLHLESTPIHPICTTAGAPLLHIDEPKGVPSHPALGYELAQIWQRIGKLQNDQTLIDTGLRACAFLDQLKTFPSIWMAEYESPAALRSTPSDQMPLSDDVELGLSIETLGPYQCAFVATGWNTGMGAVYKDDVAIINMGPSRWPEKHFGIHLHPHELEKIGKPLPGLHIKRHGSLYHYSAWTRTLIERHHLWCELSAHYQQNLRLTARFLDRKECTVKFLMAVKADTLRVGQQLEFLPKTLKKYQGSVKTVALEGKNEQMILIPEQEGEMEIIPLAGDTSYWGADFLLIYSVPEYTPHLGWNVY